MSSLWCLDWRSLHWQKIIDSDHVLLDFTLVAARLGFLAGERTGPTADSASDHSSVEIEIVGFLDRCLCYVYRFGIAWWGRKMNIPLTKTTRMYHFIFIFGSPVTWRPSLLTWLSTQCLGHGSAATNEPSCPSCCAFRAVCAELFDFSYLLSSYVSQNNSC